MSRIEEGGSTTGSGGGGIPSTSHSVGSCSQSYQNSPTTITATSLITGNKQPPNTPISISLNITEEEAVEAFDIAFKVHVFQACLFAATFVVLLTAAYTEAVINQHHNKHGGEWYLEDCPTSITSSSSSTSTSTLGPPTNDDLDDDDDDDLDLLITDINLMVEPPIIAPSKSLIAATNKHKQNNESFSDDEENDPDLESTFTQPSIPEYLETGTKWKSERTEWGSTGDCVTTQYGSVAGCIASFLLSWFFFLFRPPKIDFIKRRSSMASKLVLPALTVSGVFSVMSLISASILSRGVTEWCLHLSHFIQSCSDTHLIVLDFGLDTQRTLTYNGLLASTLLFTWLGALLWAGSFSLSILRLIRHLDYPEFYFDGSSSSTSISSFGSAENRHRRRRRRRRHGNHTNGNNNNRRATAAVAVGGGGSWTPSTMTSEPLPPSGPGAAIKNYNNNNNSSKSQQNQQLPAAAAASSSYASSATRRTTAIQQQQKQRHNNNKTNNANNAINKNNDKRGYHQASSSVESHQQISTTTTKQAAMNEISPSNSSIHGSFLLLDDDDSDAFGDRQRDRQLSLSSRIHQSNPMTFDDDAPRGPASLMKKSRNFSGGQSKLFNQFMSLSSTTASAGSSVDNQQQPQQQQKSAQLHQPFQKNYYYQHHRGGTVVCSGRSRKRSSVVSLSSIRSSGLVQTSAEPSMGEDSVTEESVSAYDDMLEFR